MGQTTMFKRTTRSALAALTALTALLGVTESAQAQEILLTGPLAGAPAVRKLRLYRQGRIEIAPAVSFTLLDEYQRTIALGARINYNITDWLAIGVWGAWGGLKLNTDLTDRTQDVNKSRRQDPNYGTSTTGRLTAVNLGPDLGEQLGGMQWVAAPQLTAVPFRGKLALFQKINVDADLYFFGGPAFVGLEERKDCRRGACIGNYDLTSRVAIAPTFGLGFTFYVNKWNAVGVEWRGLPYAYNPAGFDTAGRGTDEKFPDDQINEKDRQFKFNQMLTLSWSFYLPREYRVSE
jgi:hypothetical protein